MLNKKGFLLVESILLFEIVIIVISMLSMLAFVIHGHEVREQERNFEVENEEIKKVYKHYQKTS